MAVALPSEASAEGIVLPVVELARAEPIRRPQYSVVLEAASVVVAAVPADLAAGPPISVTDVLDLVAAILDVFA